MSLTPAPVIRIGNLRVLLRCNLIQEDLNTPNVSVPVNLTNATSVQMEIEKPNGERLPLLTATIKTPPGTDGIIEHLDTSVGGLWNEVGRWKVRGIATFSDGSLFKGSWTGFPVSE